MAGQMFRAATQLCARLTRCGIGALILVLMFPAIAPAEDIAFSCKVLDRQSSIFQPATVNIRINPATLTALISDEVIASTGRKSVAGNVDTMNATRLTVVWTVVGVKRDPKLGTLGGSSSPKVGQRLTILFKSGEMYLQTKMLSPTRNRYEYRSAVACSGLK